MNIKLYTKISNCKKCGSEAALQRSETLLSIRVKCSKCDNATPFECFSPEAIADWERKNK